MSIVTTIKRLVKVMIGRDVFYRVQEICATAQHGSEYGAWTICPENLTSNSVVYSFGVGEDITFDLSLIKTCGLQIHAFDPTPRSIQWVKSQPLPTEFSFHEYGVAGHDGMAAFSPPKSAEHVSHTILYRASTAKNAIGLHVYRIPTIMKMLGHKQVDLLKMDVEGAEYDVIDDICHLNTVIPQVLIEFHHYFNEVGVQRTVHAIDMLNSAGYKIFSISPSGREYSFIRS